MAQNDSRQASEERQPRQAVDPPRVPREGYEWVWFPEGFWAERETSGKSAKSEQRSPGWFRRSNERMRIPLKNKIQQSTLHISESFSRRNHDPEEKMKGSPSQSKPQIEAQDTEFRDNKLLRGFQRMAPSYYHSKSPNPDTEGLCGNIKRHLQAPFAGKKSNTDPAAASPPPERLQSRTTLILQGTTRYFEGNQSDRSRNHAYHTYHEASPGSQSPDSKGERRRFGLAPWHRRNSNDTVITVTSSLHELLMGEAPRPTPNSEVEYTGHGGQRYRKVEISDPKQDTFLPSVSLFVCFFPIT